MFCRIESVIYSQTLALCVCCAVSPSFPGLSLTPVSPSSTQCMCVCECPCLHVIPFHPLLLFSVLSCTRIQGSGTPSLPPLKQGKHEFRCISQCIRRKHMLLPFTFLASPANDVTDIITQLSSKPQPQATFFSPCSSLLRHPVFTAVVLCEWRF